VRLQFIVDVTLQGAREITKRRSNGSLSLCPLGKIKRKKKKTISYEVSFFF
jgi:hypothetical protein